MLRCRRPKSAYGAASGCVPAGTLWQNNDSPMSAAGTGVLGGAPFRAAIAAGDIDAAIALVSDDVIFRSPVVLKPYHGQGSIPLRSTQCHPVPPSATRRLLAAG